jgi:hypothetical protein
MGPVLSFWPFLQCHLLSFAASCIASVKVDILQAQEEL